MRRTFTQNLEKLAALAIREKLAALHRPVGEVHHRSVGKVRGLGRVLINAQIAAALRLSRKALAVFVDQAYNVGHSLSDPAARAAVWVAVKSVGSLLQPALCRITCDGW